MSELPGDWLPWIEVLGWTLLHFLWQGALVGVGFAAACVALPRERCEARYAVGLSALALLAACPVVTFVSLQHRAIADTGRAAAGVLADTVVSAYGQVMASTGAAVWLPWMVLLWLVGVAFAAARMLCHWHELARIVRHGAVPATGLEAMRARLSRDFALASKVRVLVSEWIDTPTLIGWVKPVVLLPTAVALRFPRQQIELILAHEFGHLARYDHLVNLAQSLLEILLFYHPVVWWISREVRNERELCCDALVLRRTSSVPRDYARALAGLEELRHSSPMQRLTLAASGGVLLERVRRIVGMPVQYRGASHPGPGFWLGAAAILTIVLAMVLRGNAELAPLVTTRIAVNTDWPSAVQPLRPAVSGPVVPLQRPHFRPVAVDRTPEKPETVAADASAADASPQVRAPSSSGNDVPDRVAPVTTVAAIPEATAAPEATIAARDSAQASEPASARPSAQVADESGVRDDRPAPAAPRKRPVAVRIVPPAYSASNDHADERVEFGFNIGPDGTVRDAHLVSGDADGAFARAAARALRQWRFDPATVTAGQAYTQAFVFDPNGGEHRGSDEAGCIQSTGSHICRRPGDVLPARMLAGEN